MTYRLAPFVIALVIGLAAFVPTAQADGIEGIYSADGTNPGTGDPYSGTAEITRTGDTYWVEWTIGKQTFGGTGIYRDGILAVSYAGEFSGIVVYRMHASGGDGLWAVQNAPNVGTETLRRR